MLSLPVPGKGSIFVVFRDKKQNRVAGVYFAKDKAMNERTALTNTVLRHGPYTKIKTIYRIAARFLSGKSTVEYQL